MAWFLKNLQKIAYLLIFLIRKIFKKKSFHYNREKTFLFVRNRKNYASKIEKNDSSW
jgi:hypothetical protein